MLTNSKSHEAFWGIDDFLLLCGQQVTWTIVCLGVLVNVYWKLCCSHIFLPCLGKLFLVVTIMLGSKLQITNVTQLKVVKLWLIVLAAFENSVLA